MVRLAMANATLECLPNELLVQILTTDSLDIRDILRSARLNSRFYGIITATVEIQYRLLLLQSNLVNNDAMPSDLVPLSKRIEMLQAYRAAIDQLRPRRSMRITVKIPPGFIPGSTYELVNGVYARGIRRWSESILTSAITFVILPSIILNIHKSKDWTVELGFTIHDFSIDPFMDLLVAVEGRLQPMNSSPLFPIHFLTMRGGKPHPDARLPYVEFCIPNTTHMVDYRDYLFIIQVCSDFVGVLFRPRIRENAHHLVIWNWRTGDVVCTYTAQPPTVVASFAFLDTKHILLAACHERVSEFTFDVLRIDRNPFVAYCFHPPELAPTLSIHGPVLRSSPCRVLPSGQLSSTPLLPPGPFYSNPSPDCRIFSLSLEFQFEMWLETLPHRVISARGFTLFAPASLFLNPAPGLTPSTVSTTHIPWSWWAPHARWVDTSADPGNSHVCHTFGPRHVRWTSQPRSPAFSSPGSSSASTSPPGLTPSPQPPSPHVQLLTFPPPSLPLPPSECNELAPPVIHMRSIFAEAVDSELPYTVRTAAELSGLEECEGLCVDGFERIIGLDARDDSEQAETLTVCVF